MTALYYLVGMDIVFIFNEVKRDSLVVVANVPWLQRIDSVSVN